MSQKDSKPPAFIYITTDIIQGIAAAIAKFFAFLLLRVEYEGLENLKNMDTGVIFAANHAGDLDSILIRTAFPVISRFAPLYAVGRAQNVYKWKGWRKFVYSDWFFRAMGAWPAVKGTKDYATSLRTFVHIGQHKESILIFIGGRQWSADEPIKNRGGATYLAHATELPIIPVAVIGTYGFKPKNFWLDRPKITIRFGIPRTKDELFDGQDVQSPDYKAASSIVVGDIELMRNRER